MVFTDHPYVRPLDRTKLPKHFQLWRLADRVTGAPWFKQITWIPSLSSQALPAGMTVDTPAVEFPAHDYVRGGEVETGPNRYRVRFKVTWTADRAELRSLVAVTTFPTARDERFL